MRQGQQNRRGRGRNRKGGGQNPLTRNLESNGPDVKIRGTAAHVAEKYMALARDAQSSGDPVLAENYLQHAEHYNRIIMAFREQQVGHGNDMMNGGQRFRGPHDPADFGDDYDDDGDEMSGGDQPTVRMPGDQTMAPQGQPRFEQPARTDDYRAPQDHDQGYGRNRFRPRHPGQRSHDQRHGNQRHDGNQRGYPPNRQDRGERPERMDRADRFDGDRFDRPERIDRPERVDRPERIERPMEQPMLPEMPAPIASPPPIEAAVATTSPAPARAERGDAPPRARRERPAPQPLHEQPEFLRRPVRRTRRDTASASANGEGAPEAPTADTDAGADKSS